MAYENNAFVITNDSDFVLMDIPGIIDADDLSKAWNGNYNKPPTVMTRQRYLNHLNELGITPNAFKCCCLIYSGNDFIPRRIKADLSDELLQEFPYKHIDDIEQLRQHYHIRYNGKEEDFDTFFRIYDMKRLPPYDHTVRFIADNHEDEDEVLEQCGITREEIELWTSEMFQDIMTTDYFTSLVDPELNGFSVISKAFYTKCRN